ncbi:MAG: DNA primase [Chloroflexi bacterium]|nr:DNA primase [Chloroflexota bacterium]
MNEIEEVKSRLDIAEVVGQHVQLQKAGRSLKGLCPFHTEKTPSFIVTPDRQTWHCFGACGTGGDVISFVMKKEGLDFIEALKLLADRAGVKLPERTRTQENKHKYERLYAANEAAVSWFRQLLTDADAASGARAYLERRGIDSSTGEAFKLGYSQDSWDGLRDHLRDKGFSNEELIAAGLIIEGEKSPYDRFRGRLMFPIQDPKGHIVGFGARALDDSTPKYLNTPQTAIFDKGSLLYGFDRAQPAIRLEAQAVIVEGYMDVIAAHQHGFDNVIASMGTALTERQVRILKRSAPRVVLALDADAAGTEAAVRGHDVIRDSAETSENVVPVMNWRGLVTYQSSVSIELNVAVLPEGKDPDDVIRGDVDEWRRLVEGAQPVLDFRLDTAANAQNLDSPSERSALVREFLPLLTAVTDPIVRAHYLQRLGTRARVSERDLGSMLRRSRTSGPDNREQERSPGAIRRGDPKEEFLLALLLRYPQIHDEGVDVTSELLWESENRQILEIWKDSEDQEGLNDALPMELQPHLERLLDRRLPSYDTKEAIAALYDCVAKLEARQTKADKRSSEALLSAIEETLGPAAMSADGDSNPDDEQTREFESALNRDMETGLKLHARERSDPQTRIETGANG